MARKERLFIAGMPQLIAFKGNNNEAIFRDSADYRFFLSCLKKACAQHAVELHAFSLLKSQIFLLLSADDKQLLARYTQYLGRCYVAYFNHRHQRTGVLWEGRYRSCSIEPASYFLLCQKYVESRVDAGVVDELWSSARVHAGGEELNFLTPHASYLALAPDPAARFACYRQFLTMPLGASFVYRIEECLRQNCVLGSVNYCLELESRLHQAVRPQLSGRPRKHYPNKLNYWLWLEQEAQSCIQGYAYREIRLPVLEGRAGAPAPTTSSILRREGTMGCLATIAERHMGSMPARFWYQGPMFRTHHLTGVQVEQFHQIGAEALGYRGVDIELEQLLIQYDLIQRLKLTPYLELQINTLGEAADLARYRFALRQIFAPVVVDSAVQARIADAPETLLGADSPFEATVLARVPPLTTFLSDEAVARFAHLTQALASAGIPFTHRLDLMPHNPYYQQTFYEWQTTYLDGQSVVCRGGRYDDAASRVIGRTTSACGFAFMVEPLIQLAEKSRSGHHLSAKSVDVAILSQSVDCVDQALHLGVALRGAFPYLAVVNDYTRARVAGKLARALKSGARIVVSVHPAGDVADLYSSEPALRVELPLAEVLGQVRRWLM